MTVSPPSDADGEAEPPIAPPLSAADRARFSAIIDVRSPSEFAEDHVPGAINLPVLDDRERAEVGTLYVQVSKFQARKIGAALTAQNIARHLQGPLADKPREFAPLVYCWRGGQRSGAMATVLGAIGWRAETLKGGYKTYRRGVIEALYHRDPSFRVVLLDGNTGTAKTEMLERLTARGVQTLDLEELAAHRGSVFGAAPDRPQPGQKWFESALLDAIERLDPSRPVVVEAESSRIGERQIPPLLWKAMSAAPAIRLTATPRARARYLLRTYPDLVDDAERRDELLTRLIPLHGKALVGEWRELAAAEDLRTLAEALIAAHYDPAYARSRARHGRAELGAVALGALKGADQEAAADEIAAMVEAFASGEATAAE